MAEYEERTVVWPKVSPGEVLRDLMEHRGMKQAEFARQMGVSPSLICDLLNGRSGFTAKRIQQLAAIFDVEAGMFI